MDQKIGKYRILERIGHGGMGSVYKAHDPVLDRPVALKVISAETDHTDELRARFFREAQACAKLSHPNIVTIHDLGEADGNLFIVMELLEGDELRQLIAKRAITHLEDKFPVMVQICEGLEFAHDKGIVHRDVKPANIFVLRNGQVKILDFGIAHIAAAQTGLTRAGLIVGTLRYMAPERARGLGSHHSDIFSVGAVFYELLTNRAPFTGDDPIEILEKLRSQDPSPLGEVEPTLPPELGKILERALQKDPARRFANLGEMRTELQRLRRRIGENADRVRRDVQERLRRLHELRGALEARLGGPWADETVFLVDERTPLATLESVDKDTTGRIERLQELLTRADTLRPALDRGLEALRNGEFERAVAGLDRVVSEMPEHTRAAEGLREAQQHVDAYNQRREHLASLMREATAAYDGGAYARCLEVLGWVTDSASPSGPPTAAVALRRSAEAAIAREQAEEASRLEARRLADSATAMRGSAERARRAAEVAAPARHQASLWASAEAKFAAGLSALAGEEYAQGEREFEEARLLYERAEADAREAQSAATAALARHTAAPATGVDSSDETVFVDTSTLRLERLEAAATVPALAPPPPAPTLVPPPVTSRTLSAPPAPDLERVQPASRAVAGDAEARSSVGARVSALPRRYLTLAMAGGVAVALVVWLSSGRDAGRGQWESLDKLRGSVIAARNRAIKAEAPALAPESLSKAEASQAEGKRLSTARDLAGATQAYQGAVDAYGDAEKHAQTRREQRTEADAARDKMAAEKQRAAPNAADFDRAAELERQGSAMYSQRSFAEATKSFRAAAELFAKALPSPAPAAPAVASPVPVAPAAAPPVPVAAAPAPPAPADPRAQVRALLHSYVRAAETKDVELMRRIRPGLSDNELRQVRAFNEIKRTHKVDLRVYEITVTGDEAQAQGRREDVVVLSSGQRVQTETRFTYTLKRGPRGWEINEVRESADRAPAETRPSTTRTPPRPEGVTR